MSISIIVPCYNEEKTINQIISKLLKLEINKEIIVIDDCSSDDSLKKLEIFGNKIKILINKKNKGKGYCVRRGFKLAVNKIVVIQDGDLEYNPDDIVKLYNAMCNNNVKIVYGTRAHKKNKSTKGYLINKIANDFLSLLTSIFIKQKITDAHTCYKMFKTSLIKGIEFESNGFEICPELNIRLGLNHKILELPISYNPRKYEEGKKIKFSDGVIALKTMIIFRFFKKNSNKYDN